MVIKNVQRIARSVKRARSKLEDPKLSYNKQYFWVLLNSMEAFTIAVLGFAATVELLYPTILASSEVLYLFRTIAFLYA